jgi:proline dehydrogenase
MELLNRLVVASIPLVPLPVVRRLASRYIAGESLADAVAAVRQLMAEGACATLDVLGEDVLTREQATAARKECTAALEAMAREGIDSNLSIKLTSLGLKIDRAFCEENLRALLTVAARARVFVRFDMEDSSCTDDTLALFRTLHAEFPATGVVLQACLRRTESDLRELLPVTKNFRLVKGIYREPEQIAYQGREEVRDSFRRLLARMLDAGAYVGIATHDDALVESAEQTIAERALEPSQYEFQMLLGVLPELRRKLIGKGHKLRVYVPYGANWYGYSTRRFKENPTVAGYVFRALFHQG